MVKNNQSGNERQSNAVPGSYAGDITPQQAWERLGAEPASVLVDVRTRVEWMFVGVPDFSGLAKEPLFIEWQSLPSMAVNADFVDDFTKSMSQIGADNTAPVFFLCRSGGRSLSAARACTAAGFNACYNIVGGFEGDLDAQSHRGTVSGWKHEGLAWIQK